MLSSKSRVINTDHTNPIMAQSDVEPPIAKMSTDFAPQQEPALAASLDTISEHEPVELANGHAPSERSHDPIAERLKLVEQRFAGMCCFNYPLMVSQSLMIYCAE